MITRRFLVTPALARLIGASRGTTPVIEGFFQPASDRSLCLRIDRRGPRLILSAPREAHDPEDDATDIPAEHARVLLAACAGTLLFEQSSLTLASGRQGLVRRFKAPHECATIDVAFPDRDAADRFARPLWFGPELTDDTAGTNRGLALGGMPQPGPLSLADAALEALIDLFETPPQPGVEQEPGFAADPADVTAPPGGPADQGLGAAERAGDDAVPAARPRSSFARFQNGHALAHPGPGRSAQGRERAAGA